MTKRRELKKKLPVKEETYDKMIIRKLKSENRRLLKVNNIMKSKIKTFEDAFESSSKEIQNLITIIEELQNGNTEN